MKTKTKNQITNLLKSSTIKTSAFLSGIVIGAFAITAFATQGGDFKTANNANTGTLLSAGLWNNIVDQVGNSVDAISTNTLDILSVSGSLSTLSNKFGNLTNKYFPVFDGTKLIDSVIVQSGGNVGVGTTSPQTALQINNTNNDFYPDTRGVHISGYPAIEMNAGGAGVVPYIDFADTAGEDFDYRIMQHQTDGLKISTSNNNNAIVVNSGGNVGIGGTASPGARLNIVSNNSDPALRIFDGTSNAGTIQFKRNDGWNPVTIASRYVNGYGGELDFKTHPMDGILGTDPVTIMTIASNGSVGIGTTEPSSKLYIYGDDGTVGQLVVEGDASNGSYIGITDTGVHSWVIGQDASSDILKFRNGNTTATTTMQLSSAGLSIGTPEAGGYTYLQIDTDSGPPSSTECDNDSEKGRMAYDQAANYLYICRSASGGWQRVAMTDAGY